MSQKTPSEISISTPTTEEVEQILAVHQESAVLANVILGVSESEARARVTTPRFIAKTQHWREVIDGTIEATLKVAHNKLTEVIGFGECYNTPCGPTILRALYVSPDYQGQGVGSLLLEETLPKDPRSTYLLAPLGSAAIAFYMSHGFRVNERYSITHHANPEYGLQMHVNSVQCPLIEMVRPAYSSEPPNT